MVQTARSAQKSKRKGGSAAASAPLREESAEAKLARLERELKELRKENDQLRMDREIQKKRSCLLREGRRMKFAFIHAEKANFPVAALCRVFCVTLQGYYAFRSRPAPELRAREVSLREQVRQMHAESRGTYGPQDERQLVRLQHHRDGAPRLPPPLRRPHRNRQAVLQ
jgi:hypothetical protein